MDWKRRWRDTARALSSSSKNVEVIRRVLEATKREDWDAVAASLDPKVEINDPTLLDARGEHRGRAGFLRWVTAWGDSWETWRMDEIEIVTAIDDQVLVRFRMTVQGKGSGVRVEGRNAIVYKLRDGKIVRIRYYDEIDQALEAAGLRE